MTTRTTLVTERVYRHRLKPVITKGAATMSTVCSKQEAASAQDAPAAQKEAKSA